jgi:hypothetical protein
MYWTWRTWRWMRDWSYRASSKCTELGKHGDEHTIDLTGRHRNVLNLENMEMSARLILLGVIGMYDPGFRYDVT